MCGDEPRITAPPVGINPCSPLFAVNTGCRDGEIYMLRWEWEMKLQSMNISAFIMPGSLVKNGDPRLMVLNRIAMSVVEAMRG